MVQVIPQMMGLGEQIGAAFGGGLQQGIPQGIQTLQNQLQQHRENTALKELSQKWKPDTPDAEIMNDIMTAPVSKESKQLYLSGMGQLMKQKEQEKKRTFLENIISGRPQAAVEEQVTETTEVSKPVSQISKPAIQKQGGFSEEQIAAATMADPSIGRMMQSQNEAVEKKLERKARMHTPITTKYFEKINERADVLPQKESALTSMERAISEGDFSAFSRDNLADITGIEALRTAKGAEFISSGKEFFLGSLKRAGARPNQWVEQQIQKMLPKIGRSKEANLTVTEALKNELDIEKKQIELSNEIADDLENKLGYVPRNIGSLVMQKMKPYAEQKQKELASTLKDISKGKVSNKEETSPTERVEVKVQEFEETGKTFEKMPSPAQFKDQVIEDDKGNKFISTGKTWRKM